MRLSSHSNLAILIAAALAATLASTLACQSAQKSSSFKPPAQAQAPALVAASSQADKQEQKPADAAAAERQSNARQSNAPQPLQSSFNTVAPPNPPYANCTDFPTWGATNGAGIFPSRSRHPGGSHHAMCDGSVRFIGNSIALITYQNLGTIAGGEVVGEY